MVARVPFKRRDSLMPAKTHGLSKHKLYSIWRAMRRRCSVSKDPSYVNYGARGIRVCTRWQKSFACFYSDVSGKYKIGLTLERKNNNKGYSKSNCRWATRFEQQQNRRGIKKYKTEKGKACLAELCRRHSISYGTVRRRQQRGWPDSALFIRPSFKNKTLRYYE